MRRGGTGTFVVGVSVVATLILGAGCGVGDGSGIAGGTLFVAGCRPEVLGVKPLFDLNPTFFAGQPIEDICLPHGDCLGERTNRLIIRMQRRGKRTEVDDTIFIDIENSVEVARCIRGSTKAGVKAWDHRNILNPDGSPTNIPFCDWSWIPTVDGGAADAGAAGDDGGVVDGGAGAAPMTAPRARINLSTLDFVRGSIMPLESCFEQRLVGVSLPGSYIEFEDFGTAAQPDLPPDERGEIGGDFKVLFGERLRATFHLELGDQRVTNAMHKRDSIPPTMISGVIDGQFDFDLDRTRAAQPFP